MKLGKRSIIAAMLVMLVGFGIMPAKAEAKEVSGLPVEIKLNGPLPSLAETFTVEVTPNDPTNPMPETENGVYTMTFNGAGTKNLPTVNFDKVGVYEYTIKQLPGSYAGAVYDKTEYTLRVVAQNDVNDAGEIIGGLTVTLRAHKGETGDDGKMVKYDSVTFTNTYPTPEVPPTTPEEEDDEDEEDDPPTVVNYQPPTDPGAGVLGEKRIPIISDIVDGIGQGVLGARTGDATSILIWIILAAAGVATVVTVLVRRRRTK